ncbi:MAG: sulfite exporter TauE/SafE family protein [Lactobacillus sp.]|nr:sulfite exporter TauE/SafE family protein [Lactobacillus sp.]
MFNLWYFLIIIVANALGAVSGMGGGVIIKPMMDALAASPLNAINFYSALAVFVMAMVSTYRQVSYGMALHWPALFKLSSGAVIGGILGDSLINWLLLTLRSEQTVNLIQIGLTIMSLVLALLFTRPLRIQWGPGQQEVALVASGLLLGTLATLLGIGGGPINVALLIAIFSLEAKTATVYSIGIILFSQLAKLSVSLMHFSSLHVQLSTLPVIVLAAIIGGALGATLSRKMDAKQVMRLYRMIVSGVILLNLYNAWQILF